LRVRTAVGPSRTDPVVARALEPLDHACPGQPLAGRAATAADAVAGRHRWPARYGLAAQAVSARSTIACASTPAGRVPNARPPPPFRRPAQNASATTGGAWRTSRL